MNIEQKFAYLVTCRICDFNPFALALMTECWRRTGGVVALADTLPEGRQQLIRDLYETMTRDERMAA